MDYQQSRSVEYLKYISRINNHEIDISFDEVEGDFEYMIEQLGSRIYFKKQKGVINYLKQKDII